MAIPFIVDDDRENDEILLQQVLSELCRTLRQIRVVQRNIISTRVSRSRAIWNQPAIEVSTSIVDIEHRFPDFGVNVSLSLTPFGVQNDLETPAATQNATASGENIRRRRSRSEPPCFEETKPVKVSVSVEVINREWPKQEQPVQPTSEKSTSGPRSLLSKLVPAPLGGPIWTAVICVVGWHLLRAR